MKIPDQNDPIQPSNARDWFQYIVAFIRDQVRPDEDTRIESGMSGEEIAERIRLQVQRRSEGRHEMFEQIMRGIAEGSERQKRRDNGMSWDDNYNRHRHRQRDHRNEQQSFIPLEQAEDTRIDPGMSRQEIEQRIRKRIAKRTKERNDYIGHLISFITINIMLWGLYFFTTAGGFPWPMFVTGGWGIGLLIHTLTVYQNSGRVVARREDALRREVEREKARLGLLDDAEPDYYEKPKRGTTAYQPQEPPETEETGAYHEPRMRLGDDGELVPLEDEPDSYEDDQKQGRMTNQR